MLKNEEDLNRVGNELLSHYRKLKMLGTGGMGEVYLAEDIRLNRKVALKILPESFAADAQRLSRFEREARAASALNHPNILTVHEFGIDGKVHFLATELVIGETLREKINGGALPVPEALDIAAQIAFALSAAHAAGIVHRDIKPENIMIRADGIVKVLDFGIAKLIAPPVESIDAEGETLAKAATQTKPGVLIGTLHYMSPEQVRGQPPDARSDIFSLGVVIYEMLTGKEPFDRQTPGDVIAAILTENQPSVTRARPEAPAELERILSKALRKNKDERYQTSKDLLLDIKSLQKEIEFSDNLERKTAGGKTRRTADEEIYTTSAPAPRKFSLASVLGIFLAAGLAFGGIWWFTDARNNQTEALQPSSLNTVEVVNWRSAPGEVYSAGTFSPDGKTIAFTSTKTGTKNIWIKQISGGEAVQVTKDEFSNQHPIWSPGGDEIAFYSTRGGTSGIWRTPSLGGTPIFVKTIEDSGMALKHWSKKDSIYYEANRNLHSLDIKSGQSLQLTNFDVTKVNPNSIKISPDEERIAYIAFENEKYTVWTMPVKSGGSPVQVVSFSDEIRNPVWHPDGKRILYSMNVAGIFQIFAVNTNDGKTLQITSGEKDSFALDVSGDGAKILYGSSKEESDLWGANIEKGEEFSFASDISFELWSNVSPDSKTVAYQAIKNPAQGANISSGAILIKPVDSEAQPFQLATNGFLPTWSPDGKQLAFMRVAGETFNLWTVKAVGGDEKQLTTGGTPSVEFTLLPYNRTQTSYINWSPDSKKIAYVSGIGGYHNVWLVNADDAGSVQLTNNTDSNVFLFSPLWSSDGRRMAYSAKSIKPFAGDKKTYAAFVTDAETKNTKIVVQSETFQRLLGWSESDRELIFAGIDGKQGSGAPTEVSIIQVNIETGKQQQLTKIESAYLYNIYLSANKKMLAYVSKKDGKDNVWVMGGSRGEPRKITFNNDARLYFSSMSWSPDNRAVYFGKQTRYSLISMITNFK